ncbi:MAG: M56 family metallopeptidase [Myxococcota bacterium]
MTGWTHDLLGAAWSYLFLAGALTLAARLWLRGRLARVTDPVDFDRPAVHAALVVPALLPLVWLASALVHVLDTGGMARACCDGLALGEPGWRQAAFGLGGGLLAVLVPLSLRRRWRSAHPAHAHLENHPAARRVRALCGAHPRLGPVADRVAVVGCAGLPCATRGYLRPRIEIAADLVARLDDRALEAALLHELSHLVRRDPLQVSLVLLAQAVNPFASLLSRPAEAWAFAREVHCDRHAVAHGLSPVAVAEALVTAARLRADHPAVQGTACALCDGDTRSLTARVELLLATDRGGRVVPERDQARESLSLLVVLSGAALLVPHLIQAQALSLHCVLEHLLAALTLH